MAEARQGFQDGLSLEQVGFYYKPEFDWEQMKEARLKLIR